MALRQRRSVPPKPAALEEVHEDISMAIDMNSSLANSNLQDENKRLLQELEALKKLLKRYEQERNSGRQKNNRIPPPPPLPSLNEHHESRRKHNDQPLEGLHYRAQPHDAKSPRGFKSIDSNNVIPDDTDIESPRADSTEEVSLLHRGDDDYPYSGNHDHDDDTKEAIPCTTFGSMILDRAGWLVGLLVLQSMSSFIIQRNEGLLQKHLVIVRFLTMLVGAGGNAGNQASVQVIRGLAIGTIRRESVRPFLINEFFVGLCLSVILGVAGCLRAAVFSTPLFETVAITTSLFLIVMISVVLGATLPLGMKLAGIDPAHSSTTIQVLMDILGVTITVYVSSLILDSPMAAWLGVGAASTAT